MWEVVRYFRHHWIEAYYTGKQLYFTYPFFSWVHPWPTLELMQLHFAFMGVCALLVAIGLFYRFASIGLFLSFAYVFLLEQARYLNHFYFVVLLLITMMFVPAHRMWSVDRLRAPSLPRANEQWALWALRAQFGITYLYGGIAKLNGDWLSGHPLQEWVADGWMGIALSFAGLLLDIAFVPLLLCRRTRVIGFALAVAFNGTNAYLFHIGIFPWLMIAGTLLFFDADWPARLMNNEQYSMKQENVLFNITTGKKLLAAFLGVFFLVQLLVPFRHLLYEGSVHWTEEGHLFSWHMKLRSKSGDVRFIIHEPSTQRILDVNPAAFLTKNQIAKMSARPDLILQFAHFLRDHFAEQGIVEPEVYAESFATLNHHPQQRLIDPTVDLAKVQWSLRHAEWILPLPSVD